MIALTYLLVCWSDYIIWFTSVVRDTKVQNYEYFALANDLQGICLLCAEYLHTVCRACANYLQSVCSLIARDFAKCLMEIFAE